jgi:hypothetical protein
MIPRRWIWTLLIGGFLLVLAAPFLVLQFRIARSAAFCDAVEGLPRVELEEFASRCDRLLQERGGPDADLQFIKDATLLARFALAGRTPDEIVVKKDHVGIHFFTGNWRHSTSAFWMEEHSPDGDRIQILKITYGTFGWRILCQREVSGANLKGWSEQPLCVWISTVRVVRPLWLQSRARCQRLSLTRVWTEMES